MSSRFSSETDVPTLSSYIIGASSIWDDIMLMFFSVFSNIIFLSLTVPSWSFFFDIPFFSLLILWNNLKVQYCYSAAFRYENETAYASSASVSEHSVSCFSNFSPSLNDKMFPTFTIHGYVAQSFSGELVGSLRNASLSECLKVSGQNNVWLCSHLYGIVVKYVGF